jgi:hypothetical protein
VVVDEPRGDDQAVGVDGARGGTAQLPGRHNLAAAHRDVAAEGGESGAVDHATVLDEQIIRHVLSLLGRRG